MGIVRLRERKSNERHETKAFVEKKANDPPALGTPIARKNGIQTGVVRGHSGRMDEHISSGCGPPAAD